MRYILFIIALGFTILGKAQMKAFDIPGFSKAPDELRQSGSVRLTLSDALTTGKKNGPGIKNAILDVSRAHQQVREIQAVGLPQVNASLGFNYNAQVPGQEVPNFMKPIFEAVLAPSALKIPLDFFPDKIVFRLGQKYSTSNSITLTQLVFDGTYLLGLKAAKEFESLSKISLERSETEALNNIAKAYALCWFLTENENNLKNSISNLEKTQRELSAIYQQGLSEKLDVDRIVVTISNVKSQLENLKVMKENAFRLLKFQMGMDLNENVELADNFQTLNQAKIAIEEASGENAFKNRPEYRLLEKSITLNQLSVKRYKVGYLPSVAAFATHQQNAFSDELKFKTFIPGTIVGLSVSVPVFDGFRKEAQKKIAGIDLAKSIQQKAEFENALRLDISSNQVKLSNALTQLTVQEENIKLTTSIYETVKKKFDAGMASSFELISADNDIRSAQANLTNARYEVLNAQIDLKKAIGKTF